MVKFDSYTSNDFLSRKVLALEFGVFVQITVTVIKRENSTIGCSLMGSFS